MKLGWSYLHIEAIIISNASKYFTLKPSYGILNDDPSDAIDFPSTWK